VADKLGAKAITAIDIDQKAIVVATKNFELNDVKDVTLFHGNLLDVIDDQADLIVANILYNILIDFAEDITKYMTEDTIFISSGILDTKKALVKATYEKNGLEIIDEMQAGEWIVLAAKKRSQDA
jgi:ribosomal protein L11 methyltransferase